MKLVITLSSLAMRAIERKKCCSSRKTTFKYNYFLI